MTPRKKEYDRLEGTYQIIRVKKLEKIAYVSQGIAITVIFFLFLHLTGAKLKPLYIPIFFPLLVTFFWLLALSIESFIFRLMEIKHRKSESAKFLMTHRSMKRAYGVIVLAVIVIFITAAPFVHQQVETRASPSGEITFTGEETVYFTSKGRFDFLFINDITVELIHTITPETTKVEVLIISVEDYLKNNTQMRLNRETGDPTDATVNDSFVFQMPRLRFEEHYIVLRSEQEVTVRYHIDCYVAMERVYPFTTLAIAFMTSYSVWVYVLYPIKKRYSSEGICIYR